jgi:hypothetical protein
MMMALLVSAAKDGLNLFSPALAEHSHLLIAKGPSGHEMTFAFEMCLIRSSPGPSCSAADLS